MARSLRAIDARLEKADQRDRPDKPCAKGVDDHASDLCAQWKAADAAYDAAVWAGRTFYLGALGFGVGVLTLFAAGAAAYFAKRAADETRRGADAAEQAVRCHLSIGDTVMVFCPEYWSCRIKAKVKNDGDTAARRVHLEARLRVASGIRYGPGADDFAFGAEAQRTSEKWVWPEKIGRSLLPRKKSEFEAIVVNFWLSEQERTCGLLRVHVMLKITYLDVFGVEGSRLEFRTMDDLREVASNVPYALKVHHFFGEGGEEWA